jgi:peptide subunit release factor 1 (eRF1)
MLAVTAFKIDKDKYQVTCPYCNKSFQFDKKELNKKGQITCPKCPQGLGDGIIDVILPKEKKTGKDK